MRWFFSLLIFANLVLAGWLYWKTEAPPLATENVNQDSAGRLQLLSELPRDSLRSIPHLVNTPEAIPPTTTANTVVNAETIISSEPVKVVEVSPIEEKAICVQVSPLARAADIESIEHKLEQENHTVLDKGEVVAERQTYWVIIPSYKTDKAARNAAELLARAKVRDFLVIHSGEFENGISLGLFSQKEGAENRLQEIRALKLNIRSPEIRLRTSSVRSFWLITRVRDGEALKTLLRQLEAQGAQSSTVACPP